ncbi:MAG: asparagine synthase [Cylindrospermopsis raciborskii KL1]|jgi:asparagine synthase (glutamine-hydrolysing)|uniref:asparagine synthetase B family protein n=1 Tax=Cylindrospermopsis raciborskii TaxID=77022 RepID=UPI001A2B5CF3|nr:asparagine synthetase B family protein [Cylindrospermopsis raciborskii]MBG0743693.1 asparagine synthase [Cylindrospermopsis raciborskii KL1]
MNRESLKEGSVNNHIIGYCGDKEQEKLTSKIQGRKKTIENGKFICEVIDIECKTPPIIGKRNHRGDNIDNIIVSICAGRIGNADIWVKWENNKLILGREIFGRVPLFWTCRKDVIWFSSQLQLLLQILDKWELYLPSLYSYCCFSYITNPLTPVEGVFSVIAGQEIVFSLDNHFNEAGNIPPKINSPQVRKTYEWRENPEKITDETVAIYQLQNLLKNAIQNQIQYLNNEPVGVFLSGGLDSSIVAALLVKSGIKVRAYALDFGKFGVSEYPYAQKVAEFLNIPLVKVDGSPKNIKKAIIPTVKALDLPFGDGVTVPLYLINQIASQETQIVFNGEGGDQLFAGWTNKPLIAAGVYQNQYSQHPENGSFLQQYLHTFHRLWGYESKVYQAKTYDQIRQLNAQEWLLDALDSHFCPSLLHRLRRANLMLKGSQNIHPRATAISFANGLNVRSPFCDLALAEWTFQLSGELCLQGACEKYILKRAVENWLPAEIVWRQKRGMGVPLTSWCLNDLWYDLGNWLNPGILGEENIFYPDIGIKVITGQLGGNIRGRRIGEILWLLIMWQLWYTHVFGIKPTAKSSNHPFLLPYWLWKGYRKFTENLMESLPV